MKKTKFEHINNLIKALEDCDVRINVRESKEFDPYRQQAYKVLKIETDIYGKTGLPVTIYFNPDTGDIKDSYLGCPKVEYSGNVTITNIDDEAITFSDGRKITYWHEQDCCEWNYADFEQLDDIARNYIFELPLKFQRARHGFRFGDSRRMFFVPCYSEQNGYYTYAINIKYDDCDVVMTNCEERYRD